ncbi:MAG: CDP-alcohol phosphatidyltransferase family protein [Pseudomonadota bacterium]
MTETPENRRPLASRDTAWARRAASWLVARDVTPNQISQLAMVFAALGFLAFALSWLAGPIVAGLMLLVAAACCQGRLICNLLDGMVAIEGGKAAKDGPFWNEAPDRVSDILLLCGAGVACGSPVLGAVAATGALATAYLRELGRAEGLGADFSGPMAKQHRMAVLTIGAVLAAFQPLVWDGSVLRYALGVIILGTVLTALRRSWRIITGLKAR